MKMRATFFLCFIVALSFPRITAAQQNELENIIKKFNDHQTQLLQEKIYAHLDRNFLLTGETLWFSIYTVDGTFHKPLGISKVAYLEVLDKNNTAVLQAKIALKEGRGNGSVFIPASIPSGNYVVRLYTQWMRNFSPDFYFQKTITIVNPFIKLEIEKKPEAGIVHAEFFPEGGNLVEGLESKVAFRVTDSNGQGILFKGSVLNENNDTLVRFSPLKFGIGSFHFKPEAAHQYKVIIQENGKKPGVHALPKVYPYGYVMTLEETGDKILLHIKSKFKQEERDPFLYLFIHTRHRLTKAEVKFPDQNITTFSINQNDFVDGITHITVLNAKQQPVCERLYFRKPQKKLNITVTTDRPSYSVRRKARLLLETSEPHQKGKTNLSVSVYKIDSLDALGHSDIFSYLWLSSELKGAVESPEFYFSKEEPDWKEAVDNLMLTHGWRRFNWDDVFQQKKNITFIPEYRGHLVRGTVRNADGTVASGILTYLSSPGKNVRLYGSRSNSKGEVLYEMKDFLGARQLILQTNTRRDSTYKIQIENPFSNQFSPYRLPPFELPSSLDKHLLSRSIAMQVQDIYLENQNNRFISPVTDSVAFYGKADNAYLLDDYTRFPVMEEVMREYVPGVMVRKRREGFHFIVLDNVSRGVLPENPMVLLDGVPVFDINKIMAFDPLKVKKLEVVNRKYYVGPLFLSGIVSYSTYQGDLSGFELDPRSVSLSYEGLQLQREFYMPHYEDQKQRNSRIPDQRTLLLWAPEANTGTEGKCQLEFFTSDVTGRYLVVAEGLSGEGFAGSATCIFSVGSMIDY